VAVVSAVERLDDRQDHNRRRDIHLLRMYSNREVMGLRGKSYADIGDRGRLSRNIIKNIVDAATAKISTKRVKPMFLTAGGDWQQKERAKKLTKFAVGQHYATDLHEKARRVFKDGCVSWRGFLKVYRDGADICCERVLPWEIIIDDEEALYGEPRQLFQHKEISRDVLKEMFPNKADDIDSATLILGRKHDRSDQNRGIADQVSVIEAWYLPSAEGAGDGRHVICCSTCTLFEEEWERDRFPFATFTWSEPVLGWRGHPLTEVLESIQIEINMLLRKAQREMKLGGMHVFVQKGAMINKQGMTNEDGAIWEYAGSTPPEVHNANTVAPETFAQIQALVQSAYDDTGISRLTAQSRKPEGLDSGKALREYYDIESERFQDVAQRYEEMILDATDLMIDLAREIDEEEEDGYCVLGMDKNELVKLRWQDVAIDKDQYVMQLYPTNFLPQTPAGKWQQVAEMGKAGFLGKEEMMELLEYPDLESVTSRNNAPYEEIELSIKLMLEDGQAQQPQPFTNLQLAGQMVQRSYLMAHKDGYPDKRLALMRDYLSALQTMVVQAQPPQPQPEVMPGAMPAPMPEALPPGLEAGVAPMAQPPQGEVGGLPPPGAPPLV
jgi:hypothetical protein